MKHRSAMWALALWLTPTMAAAEPQESWDLQLAPYLWAVGITGEVTSPLQSIDVDVGFGDILSNLDIGGSLYFAGQRGQHGFHVDYTFMRLSPDDSLVPSPPAPVGLRCLFAIYPCFA